jgi:hypothetical protein
MAPASLLPLLLLTKLSLLIPPLHAFYPPNANYESNTEHGAGSSSKLAQSVRSDDAYEKVPCEWVGLSGSHQNPETPSCVVCNTPHGYKFFMDAKCGCDAGSFKGNAECKYKPLDKCMARKGNSPFPTCSCLVGEGCDLTTSEIHNCFLGTDGCIDVAGRGDAGGMDKNLMMIFGSIIVLACLTLVSAWAHRKLKENKKPASSVAPVGPSLSGLQREVVAQNEIMKQNQARLEYQLRNSFSNSSSAALATAPAPAAAPAPVGIPSPSTPARAAPKLMNMGTDKQLNSFQAAPEGLISDETKPSAELFDWLRTTIRDELIIPSTSVTFALDENAERRVLGKGAFGEIFVGEYHHSEIAIKVMNSDEGTATSSDIARFVQEAVLMCRLRHPHVVLCLGLIWEPPKITLLLEMCGMGSLFSVLRKQGGRHTWRAGDNEQTAIAPQTSFRANEALVSSVKGDGTKMKWALEIAKGMLYLHGQTVPILHRDLKAQNVLLDNGFSAKITDFGESREDSEQGVTTEVGTPYWMAPEVFTSSTGSCYDAKVDVYSYAILLLEIHHDAFLKEKAFKKMSPLLVVHRVTTKNWRPGLEDVKETVPKIAELIEMCWKQDPDERWSFVEVVKFLENACTEQP